MIDDIFDQTQKRKVSEISQRIRAAREKAHFSQDKLGALIGVSDKSISAYEQGRSIPPINKLKKLAEATNHPISYFTAEEPENSLIAAMLSEISKKLSEVHALLEKKQK